MIWGKQNKIKLLQFLKQANVDLEIKERGNQLETLGKLRVTKVYQQITARDIVEIVLLAHVPFAFSHCESIPSIPTKFTLVHLCKHV